MADLEGSTVQVKEDELARHESILQIKGHVKDREPIVYQTLTETEICNTLKKIDVKKYVYQTLTETEVCNTLKKIDVKKFAMIRSVVDTGISRRVHFTLTSNSFIVSTVIFFSIASLRRTAFVTANKFSIGLMSGLRAGIDRISELTCFIAFFAGALFCEGSPSCNHKREFFPDFCTIVSKCSPKKSAKYFPSI